MAEALTGQELAEEVAGRPVDKARRAVGESSVILLTPPIHRY